jgi:hypothetical protein
VRDNNAYSVILFVVSFYAFAIVLLYCLSRSWYQVLSTRRCAHRENAACASKENTICAQCSRLTNDERTEP